MLVVHHPDQGLFDVDTVFRYGRMVPHIERSDRYDILLAAVRADPHEIVEAPDTGLEAILAVHDGAYVDFLQTMWSRWSQLPGVGDTPAMPSVHPTHRMMRRPTDVLGQLGYYANSTSCPIDADTWTSVTASAHVAIHAADRLAAGDGPVYALCRPPGHHAFSDLMSGGCYLNNAAIAARRLKSRYEKVAILDVDVHHGNGTQDIFWTCPDILFCSIHADPNLTAPYYAGFADEIGEGAGRGLTLNIPLPYGAGDDVFLRELDRTIAAVRDFGAEAIIVSLGFDGSEHDPVQTFKISNAGFAETARRIAAIGLPTLLVQEGGYIQPHLQDCLRQVLRTVEQATTG